MLFIVSVPEILNSRKTIFVAVGHDLARTLNEPQIRIKVVPHLNCL